LKIKVAQILPSKNLSPSFRFQLRKPPYHHAILPTNHSRTAGGQKLENYRDWSAKTITGTIINYNSNIRNAIIAQKIHSPRI
jgi:hypothetical protein